MQLRADLGGLVVTFDEQYAEVWRLCTALGLPHSPETCSTTPSAWDGTVLHGRAYKGEHRTDLWRLWHEIAHWLCARPEHRQFAGFGLGDGFGGPKSDDIPDRIVASIGVLLHLRLDPPRALDACGKLRVPEDPEVLRAELQTVPGRRAARLLQAVGVLL
jgi:hypothetical protein